LPRIVVFILAKISLTPKSFLLSMSNETNKHPISQPPTKIIFMHFERFKNWPINPAVAITGSAIIVLIWRAMGCVLKVLIMFSSMILRNRR